MNKIMYTGDFVDSEGEDDVEDEAEPVERYHQGLYHPVCIGETLDRKYRIEHKLGHGGFSTVWLAHDMEKKKDVALKIMVPGEAGEHELYMQDEILRLVPETSNLLTYEATFILSGHHGDHRVLVFPVRAPNLDSHRTQASMASRMSAAYRLLKALASLHRSRIVHRDLNQGCILWGMKPLDCHDTDTKYELLGRPQKILLETWRKGELVRPVKVPESLVTGNIYLGDFGHSIMAGTPVKCKMQSPVGYCAPERLHNVDPSYASDMWSYMCLFVELYLDYPLFMSSGSVSQVSRLVRVLGPLPEHWKGSFAFADASLDWWYDLSREPDPVISLPAIVAHRRPKMGRTEQNHLLSVMAKGFCYDYDQRITADELLQDASFKALLKMHRTSGSD